MINPILLSNALDALDFKPEIDLFASRLNRKFPNYCSFRPDQRPLLLMRSLFFGLRKRNILLQFIQLCPVSFSKDPQGQRDRNTGCPDVTDPVVVSDHTDLLRPPVTLSPSKNLLSLPESPEITHPLYRKMSLLICLLPGNGSNNLTLPTDP